MYRDQVLAVFNFKCPLMFRERRIDGESTYGIIYVKAVKMYRIFTTYYFLDFYRFEDFHKMIGKTYNLTN